MTAKKTISNLEAEFAQAKAAIPDLEAALQAARAAEDECRATRSGTSAPDAIDAAEAERLYRHRLLLEGQDAVTLAGRALNAATLEADAERDPLLRQCHIPKLARLARALVNTAARLRARAENVEPSVDDDDDAVADKLIEAATLRAAAKEADRQCDKLGAAARKAHHKASAERVAAGKPGLGPWPIMASSIPMKGEAIASQFEDAARLGEKPFVANPQIRVLRRQEDEARARIVDRAEAREKAARLAARRERVRVANEEAAARFTAQQNAELAERSRAAERERERKAAKHRGETARD